MVHILGFTVPLGYDVLHSHSGIRLKYNTKGLRIHKKAETEGEIPSEFREQYCSHWEAPVPRMLRTVAETRSFQLIVLNSLRILLHAPFPAPLL